MTNTMEIIQYKDLRENESYIVESKQKKRNSKTPVLGFSEFEESFDFTHFQLMKIYKFEYPFTIIKSRHGREFIKLRQEWIYYKPSKEFLEILNHQCREDY